MWEPHDRSPSRPSVLSTIHRLPFLTTLLPLLLFLLCACVAADPSPISVPVDTRWLGYDGNWSPVTIRVGTPPQWVYVFPSTTSQETWVIGEDGCDSTFTCRDKRGGIFFSDQSSSWDSVGSYALGFDLRLGYSGNGDYGYDDIALTEDIVVPSQIVSVINSTDHWLGYMGLGIQETNFTDVNKLSFIGSLVENQSLIPSHSYGYTAGAYHRLKGVPASLTFGGVDTNRFVENDVSFALSSDSSPIVAINSISVSAEPVSDAVSKPNWTNPQTLLDTAESNLFVIDSSTPFLWLPEAACDSFADVLNLTYNDTLELYYYGSNSSIRDELLSWNLTFTFTIADLPGSSSSVDITLPFSAFDQTLTYPFPDLDANFTSSGVRYFPLRKAVNDDQLTIGRTFLQESYLAVDYERNNFSISQAAFNIDALTNTNIVPITRPSNSNFTGPSVDDNHHSVGLKVGLGVGLGVGFACCIAVLFLWLRRRALKSAPEDKVEDSDLPKKHRWSKVFSKKPAAAPIELLGDKHHPIEAPADMSAARFELCAIETPVELPGAEVADTYYGSDGQRHRRNQGSTEKVKYPSSEPGLDRANSPGLPAYTLTCDDNGSQDAISPLSPSISQPQSTTEGSGSWRRETQWMPSPLSPYASLEQARILGTRSRHSERANSPTTPYHHQSQTLLSTTSLSPTARTGSRGSRFIEEGLRSTPPPGNRSQTQLPQEPTPESPKQSRHSRKFSWEA
ncbi:hypothetical protein FQN54_006688 [Arachnomyces sp. PD_36]|nr:hypothetical protein FQN54_006688 [Arachnomyces sp. PD_36]